MCCFARCLRWPKIAGGLLANAICLECSHTSPIWLDPPLVKPDFIFPSYLDLLRTNDVQHLLYCLLDFVGCKMELFKKQNTLTKTHHSFLTSGCSVDKAKE